MKRLLLSLGLAVMCTFALSGAAFAQTAPTPTPTPVPTNPNIHVVGKDPAGNADGQIPWYSNFANTLAASWNKSFGWTVPRPLTINLYTSGIIMAADAGFYNVMPYSLDQLLTVANQPTVAVRDRRPIGPGGGNGGWIIGVNVNYTGIVSQIAATTPPTETQGWLAYDMATGMLQDVAGTGGPTWFRVGLADLLANSTVPGMVEVGQRDSAWRMALGNNMLPSVANINSNWDSLMGADQMTRDATYKVADQAVFFLAQKVGVPALVGVLQKTSAGEDFQTALQAATGYNLTTLDSAYRVTMPAY